MRAIYKIARLELSNLFYSPVAWFILVLFVFMTGMMMGGQLEYLTRQQELMGGKSLGVSWILFFSNFSGVWPKISQWFYLILPLLTMGLISQEFNRGSIKLLFSAPISGRHIVLGKYFGIMLYGLVMMLILLGVMVVIGIRVEAFEWRAVLTGLLGLYLLFGLYAAVGLFISTLTNYPIVAAISMIFLLGFLGFISTLWQEFAFVRDVTYWMALGNRVNSFIGGMICSEDVIYFVIMSVMFICFATLKLKLLRESCSFGGRVVRYFGVFILTITIGYLTSRPAVKCYYDATSIKANTLTKASQDIMARLDGKLRLTTYVNLFGTTYKMTEKSITRDMARYEQYVRFKPEMELDYVFYYKIDTTSVYFQQKYPGKTFEQAVKDEIKMQGTRLGRYLTPEELAMEEASKGIDLSKERYQFTTLIERGSGERTFLRAYNEMGMNPLPRETEISAALKRVAMKLPRVGFLSARGGRSVVGDGNRDYSYSVAEIHYRQAMVNQGFDVVDVDLNGGYGDLDSLDVLVVAEPLEPFSAEELEMLSRYVDSGKNLLVAGKPKTSVHLTPLMEKLGLRFEPGTLVQEPVKDYTPNLFLSKVSTAAKELGRNWAFLYGYTNIKEIEVPYSIVMPGAVSIVQDKNVGFRLIPILESRDSMAWNELNTIDFLNERPILNPEMGESAGVKMTMVGLEREQKGFLQRIIVLGDADAFSMGELSASRRGINEMNGSLLMAMFEWFSYGELPVDTSRSFYSDRTIDMSMEGGALFKTMLQWVLPVLLLLIGVFVLIRRKGK